MKSVVASNEVESILAFLRHQRQVACDKALKKRKQEHSKSNDDKVGQFYKIKNELRAITKMLQILICKMKRCCSNAKHTTRKIGKNQEL